MWLYAKGDVSASKAHQACLELPQSGGAKKKNSDVAAGGDGDGGSVWPRCSNPSPSGHIPEASSRWDSGKGRNPHKNRMRVVTADDGRRSWDTGSSLTGDAAPAARLTGQNLVESCFVRPIEKIESREVQGKNAVRPGGGGGLSCPPSELRERNEPKGGGVE